jgi:hypothetical protein
MEGCTLETKMIPAAIFAFLIGAVLAWGFRVWILFPLTLVMFFATMIFELIVGSGFWAAIGASLLTGLMPQLGYAFGLFARVALVARRFPRQAQFSQLAKRRAF